MSLRRSIVFTSGKTKSMQLIKHRHPELVSGSISPLTPSASAARWMLKQVQHDDSGDVGRNPFAPSRLRVNPLSRHPREGWGPSPALYFRAEAQRRKGVSLRLCASARTKFLGKLAGQGLDSRFRGNDEVFVNSAVPFASLCVDLRSPAARVNQK
jgi:hypothetical protein